MRNTNSNQGRQIIVFSLITLAWLGILAVAYFLTAGSAHAHAQVYPHVHPHEHVSFSEDLFLGGIFVGIVGGFAGYGIARWVSRRNRRDES